MVATSPSASPDGASAGPGQADGRVVRRTAVMRDVAKLAGVSHQTVSRVLNAHPSVRPETRIRVIEAMRRLDYQPNTAARTLVTRRSHTLGLVSFDTTLVGPASMVYGIEQAARAAGYFVSIASVRTLDREAVLEAVNRLREQAVEGIIAIAPQESAVAALSEVPETIPVVGVGIGRRPDVTMVGVDNTSGAAMAVRHLLALGHQSVHHISGPADWPEAQERVNGWRETLRAAGAPFPVVLTGDWSARSGYELGQKIAGDRDVTAVFCGNDQMALGALRALYEAGRRVPEDVSVVGFDDIPEAAYLHPPLTTVRQDFGEVGRHSLELLVQQVRTGGRSGGQVLLAPCLVRRDSSSVPVPVPPS